MGTPKSIKAKEVTAHLLPPIQWFLFPSHYNTVFLHMNGFLTSIIWRACYRSIFWSPTQTQAFWCWISKNLYFLFNPPDDSYAPWFVSHRLNSYPLLNSNKSRNTYRIAQVHLKQAKRVEILFIFSPVSKCPFSL